MLALKRLLINRHTVGVQTKEIKIEFESKLEKGLGDTCLSHGSNLLSSILQGSLFQAYIWD